MHGSRVIKLHEDETKSDIYILASTAKYLIFIINPEKVKPLQVATSLSVPLSVVFDLVYHCFPTSPRGGSGVLSTPISQSQAEVAKQRHLINLVVYCQSARLHACKVS